MAKLTEGVHSFLMTLFFSIEVEQCEPFASTDMSSFKVLICGCSPVSQPKL